MKSSDQKSRRVVSAVALAASLLVAGAAGATAFDSGIPAGWSGIGNFGVLGANGVVTTSPEGGNYGWVASNTGITGLGLSGIGGTDGTQLRSSVFSANAGDELRFYFNYVTSDGAGFADYAWSRLLDSTLTEVAVLFTARTTPSGNSVPGFGMPPVAATMTPSVVTINPGGPVWSPLAGDSGACFSNGCGYSDWVQSDYTITASGNYVLEFGTVNWSDQIYDSGLAFDGITVAGIPINPVSEPTSLALLGLGLSAVGMVGRRKKTTTTLGQLASA